MRSSHDLAPAPHSENFSCRTSSASMLLVSATGQLERFIIFGSYVTAKADPNDVDVFLVMAEAFNVDEMSGDTRVIFSHAQAQSRLRASVFWATRSTSITNVDALLVGWQTKRDQTRRGIVEVII